MWSAFVATTIAPRRQARFREAASRFWSAQEKSFSLYLMNPLLLWLTVYGGSANTRSPAPASSINGSKSWTLRSAEASSFADPFEVVGRPEDGRSSPFWDVEIALLAHPVDTVETGAIQVDQAGRAIRWRGRPTAPDPIIMLLAVILFVPPQGVNDLRPVVANCPVGRDQLFVCISQDGLVWT